MTKEPLDRLDLPTVTTAIDEFERQWPHLPTPPGLAELIIDTHNRHADGRSGGLSAVVAQLWPIGAAAGAHRGHVATLAALLKVLGRIRVQELPDARGRWVVAAFRQAVLDLPTAPEHGRRHEPPKAVFAFTSVTGVHSALSLGLLSGWRAGHHQATEAVLDAFEFAVEDLVGEERMITTFLTPELSAAGLLEELKYHAYRAVENDRDNPADEKDPAITLAAAVAPFLSPAPSPAGQAFRPLRRLGRDQPPPRRVRPSHGPRSSGPGRR